MRDATQGPSQGEEGAFAAPGRAVDLVGAVGLGRALALGRALEEGAGPWLVITPGEREAEALAGALEALTRWGPGEILRLPADSLSPYDELGAERALSQARLHNLSQLGEGGHRAVVLSVAALARRTLPPSFLRARGLSLRPGQRVDRDALARQLADAGYVFSPLVEEPGSYALRGGILDVFPAGVEDPLRVELFGDEIESIRAFDPDSQRTFASLERAQIAPARELLFSPESIRRASIAARELAAEVARPTRALRQLLEEIELGEAALGVEALLPAFVEGGLVPLAGHLDAVEGVWVEDPVGCEAALSRLWEQLEAGFTQARAQGQLAFPPDRHFLSPDEAWAQLSGPARAPRWVRVHPLEIEGSLSGERVALGQGGLEALRANLSAQRGDGGALAEVARQVEAWRGEGLDVVVACASRGGLRRMQGLLEHRGLRPTLREGPLSLSGPWGSGGLWLWEGALPAGVIDRGAGLVVLTEGELTGSSHRAAPRRRAQASARTDLRALEEGDLVVHAEHGVARYLGLKHLELGGVAGDFLLLEFAGADKLYLPIARVGAVQKFAHREGAPRRLDRLGGGAFTLRKKKVKEDLLKMAAELIEIYASRRAHAGTAFSAPDDYFREFEAAFPFEETPDQAQAIEAVLADMCAPTPMDRLVCGDVGFGKTEVAMRAAMKAVLDGRQVAVLVPTTVLAAQHEERFLARFEGYPVVIKAISRFSGAPAVRETLKAAREGRVDIVIGTHRLLSRDVEFKDLGLVVLDEEQRFGVKQKEALKRLRREVDCLTLSATPIPRTLHMSLAGLRDLSIMATPPRARRAVRTHVSRYDPQLVAEAVRREIARGGQVFFVHNRVQSIEGMRAHLAALLPELRIEVAHGQQSESELERAMGRFAAREADLLLCTTIIESGLDLPSVNTLLVHNAQDFGLAQLYQLRGRVGRGEHRAHAYLLIPPRRALDRDAQRRLSAIQELSELGAGFRLASHDLDIRGGGNLLGPSQSGHVSAIGYDLYVELLDEAVRELQGAPPRPGADPEVTLQVPAFLPEAYLPDVHQRLDLYKRLALARTLEAVDALGEEVEDRCGRLPPEAQAWLDLRRLALKVGQLGLRGLEGAGGRVAVHLGTQAPIDGARLAQWIGDPAQAQRLRLTPDLKVVLRHPTPLDGPGLISAAWDLLQELEACALKGPETT